MNAGKIYVSDLKAGGGYWRPDILLKENILQLTQIT